LNDPATAQPRVNHAFVRRVSFIAGLGGILYGFDMGVIAAALIYVRDSFHLSTLMQEVLVIAVLVGVMIGALVGGAVADRIGRRKTLVWGAILFIAGSILAPLSPNVYVLFVARALLGVAVGFTSVTAPVYVSELSPPQSRGMLIGLYQFALTLGIALADLVGYWFAGQQGWRLMFAFGLLPAVLFLFMVLTVPESPRWLFAQNRVAEAETVLTS
jgi:MFS family permease